MQMSDENDGVSSRYEYKRLNLLPPWDFPIQIHQKLNKPIFLKDHKFLPK